MGFFFFFWFILSAKTHPTNLLCKKPHTTLVGWASLLSASFICHYKADAQTSISIGLYLHLDL